MTEDMVEDHLRRNGFYARETTINVEKQKTGLPRHSPRRLVSCQRPAKEPPFPVLEARERPHPYFIPTYR